MLGQAEGEGGEVGEREEGGRVEVEVDGGEGAGARGSLVFHSVA